MIVSYLFAGIFLVRRRNVIFPVIATQGRSRPKGRQLRRFAVLAILAITPTAYAQSGKPPALILKTNSVQVCVDNRLSGEKLAAWYNYTNPAIAQVFAGSPKALQQAFSDPAADRDLKKRVILDNIRSELQNLWKISSNPDHDTPLTDADIAKFFRASPARLLIDCGRVASPSLAAPSEKRGAAVISEAAPVGDIPVPAQSGAPVTSPAVALGNNEDKKTGPNSDWTSNIRVRGTSDGLSIPSTSQEYGSISSATFSLSSNGPTKNFSNALQATVGYDFHQTFDSKYLFDVVPFVSIDRNITKVSGKQSSSSRENVSVGLYGSYTTEPFYISTHLLSLNTKPAQLVSSVTYDHLWNDIDNSQLNFVHFIERPVINGLLNAWLFTSTLPFSKDDFSFQLLFDVRGDLGFYSDRGTKPSLNPNYQQIGTQFGADLSIPNWASEITLTQTYMGEIGKNRKDISLWQAGWTYNIAKGVGIKASYENGNIETTGQRVEQWLLSLSMKF